MLYTNIWLQLFGNLLTFSILAQNKRFRGWSCSVGRVETLTWWWRWTWTQNFNSQKNNNLQKWKASINWGKIQQKNIRVHVGQWVTMNSSSACLRSEQSHLFTVWTSAHIWVPKNKDITWSFSKLNQQNNWNNQPKPGSNEQLTDSRSSVGRYLNRRSDTREEQTGEVLRVAHLFSDQACSTLMTWTTSLSLLHKTHRRQLLFSSSVTFGFIPTLFV